MSKVLGIDPSLTGFAGCLLDTETGAVKEFELCSKPATGIKRRIARYEGLIKDCYHQIWSAGFQTPAITTILIEGYSYASKGRGVLDLAELGGLLRKKMIDKFPDADILEIPPATLKKYTTGKGNANKTTMVATLAKNYDDEFRTDNQADAFALAQMAAHVDGSPTRTPTKTQQEVVDKLGG